MILISTSSRSVSSRSTCVRWAASKSKSLRCPFVDLASASSVSELGLRRMDLSPPGDSGAE